LVFPSGTILSYFVKPNEPSYGATPPATLCLDNPQLLELVTITYLDQAIPSPIGMAYFETQTNTFLQLQHIEDYNPSMDVDATGVQHWLVLVGNGLLQMQLQTFKDMLNTSSYSFEKQYELTQLFSKASFGSMCGLTW
jgi:hypothetical protein